MEKSQAVRVARYLDASALAKLILDCPDEEPGREALRKYFNEEPKPFYTTSICFAETIGILKRKHFHVKPIENRISKQEYIQAYEKLMIKVFRSENGLSEVKLDQVNHAQPDIFKKAKRIVEKYNIDFADAMQIVTILHGRFSHFCEGSQSILITADEDLADAAREEIDEAFKKPDAAHKKGIIVWNCRTEKIPS